MSYSAANLEAIGRTGDWKSLGLPPLREIDYDSPIVKTRVSEAYRRLRYGEIVINPFGERLHADRRTLAHLAKRGRSQPELAVRLSELDAAEETVRNPHEIWIGLQRNRRIYIRMTAMPNGAKVINTVDETDHVLSWHSNSSHYDYYRKGKLVYLRQKKSATPREIALGQVGIASPAADVQALPARTLSTVSTGGTPKPSTP